MSMDDLLVRNAVQRMGVNASVEWIRQCISYKNKLVATNSSLSATTIQELAEFIFEMYLLADFRILEAKPLFPSIVTTPHNQTLFTDHGSNNVRLSRSGGGVILEILEIQDIGISSLKMLEACEAVGIKGDQPGGFLVDKTLPKGTLSLDLTDGVRKMKAILMESIPGIAMEMKLGAKIRVRDVRVRHGVLQLSSSNTFLLGGEVASMNQHPRRLNIMNQMKKKLGLPLDILPGSGNIVSSPYIPSTSSISTTNRAVSNIIEDNTNTGGNFFNNRNGHYTTAKVQDSALFKNSNQSIQPPANTAFNPWQPPAPVQRPESPEQDFRKEREEYMRVLEESQPKWDFHEDMENDVDMSYNQSKQEFPTMLTTDGTILNLDNSNKSSRSDSMNDSTSNKKDIQIRRSLSLKAPHSRQQEKRKTDSVGLETKTHLENEGAKAGENKWRVTGSDSSRITSPSGDDIDVMGSQLDDAPYIMDYDSNTDNMWLGYDNQKEPLPRLEYDDFSNGNKRKISPECEYDLIPERRRSRPFSPPPQPTKVLEQVEVNPKKDGDMLVHVKSEISEEENVSILKAEGNLEGRSSDQTIKKSDDAGDSHVKVKEIIPIIFKKDLNVEGGSYRAAIELLSDDDDKCDEKTSVVNITNIKLESGTEAIKSAQSTIKTEHMAIDGQANVTEQVYIKQEETLLEFDMDDDFEFMDSVKVVPEIGLEEVEVAVKDGREVRAQARIHKLGKFSLTTLAVSIPVTLLPAIPSVQIVKDELGNSQVVSRAEFKVDAILDQAVVESLLDCSLNQFRDLVRSNESEAKRTVGKLRLKLSEAEVVECQFKGLRTNISVIRELKILSKKRKPS